ncbi:MULTISPECIES: hypothetical protein [Mycobacterium]|uniref:hypothetical protein n=1 Tax=Mycobacterium TaxID=1763 RepID=UPI001CD9C4E5|nr:MULTISPECIES: hypothetical protein [Mycobacterium]MCA2242244.1 hypothetical protein [Mycobacterium sp. WUMAC-067]MCA2313721.1 hypothetical protein [Mycobacterium sp. WUMAC-025]MEE3754802.1 hypothetical protein [Mycobacterium intracellulare]
MGQTVIELADLADAGDEIAGELLAWLYGRLARHKCPGRFHSRGASRAPTLNATASAS